MTPVKGSKTPRSKLPDPGKVSENLNPNSSNPRTPVRILKSPPVASSKSRTPIARNPSPAPSPVPIEGRKFVVAKKSSRIESSARNPDRRMAEEKICSPKKKSACVALDNPLASQKAFSKAEMGEQGKGGGVGVEIGEKSHLDCLEGHGTSEIGSDKQDSEEPELSPEMGSAKIRKVRHRLMEEARTSVPESGSGRVVHLVKAFERLLSIPHPSESKDTDGEEDQEKQKGMKWILPGLRVKAEITPDTHLSSSKSCSQPDFVFTSKSIEMGSSVSASVDSSDESISSRTSGGGRRSRQNSSGSSSKTCGSKWKKKLKATCQQPFKLRTEQRGAFKQEEFHKKVEEIYLQERKQRLPIAQGLPWTNEEPECLVKPPVKGSTRPTDIYLHSDLRALDRAEFDQLIAEKMWSIEQYRLERERRQKAEEEEEIRRLRRELVPKAQPMPYFDRPFIPKRSSRVPNMQRVPDFHIPQP